MGKLKISFLFGAGAERCLGVSSGKDFLKQTIFSSKISYTNKVSRYFSIANKISKGFETVRINKKFYKNRINYIGDFLF